MAGIVEVAALEAIKENPQTVADYKAGKQEVSMGITAKSAMNCWFIDNNEKLSFPYQNAKVAKINGLTL